jgi:hypothetical protein
VSITSAARERHELAVAGRVAAAVVALAHGQRRAPLAGQVVEERGLADARGAEQHRGEPGREQAFEGLHPGPVDDADRQYGHRAAERGADVERLPGRVLAKVGLGEHHERLGLRVGGQREEALQAAHVQLAVERPHDQRQVDVRRQHLGLGAAVVRGAGDPAPAWQQGLHHAGLGVGGDPVADGREVGGAGSRVGHAPGRDAGQRAGGGQQLQPPAVRGGDACRDQIGAPERREGGLEARGPAEARGVSPRPVMGEARQCGEVAARIVR